MEKREQKLQLGEVERWEERIWSARGTAVSEKEDRGFASTQHNHSCGSKRLWRIWKEFLLCFSAFSSRSLLRCRRLAALEIREGGSIKGGCARQAASSSSGRVG